MHHMNNEMGESIASALPTHHLMFTGRFYSKNVCITASVLGKSVNS